MKPVWIDVYGELINDKRVIINRSHGKCFPGDIISNEVDRFKFKLPKSNLDTLIGVGSTTSFDIAAKLAPKNLIIIDQSIDVIMAHLYFYSPIFRISATPHEFVKNFLGVSRKQLEKEPELKKNKNLYKLFWKVRDIDNSFFDELDAIPELSEIEKKIIMETIKNNPHHKNPSPFTSICNHDTFVQQFGFLYDTSKSLTTSGMPSLFVNYKSFHFLKSQNHYDRIRNLHLFNKVQYMITPLQEIKLFTELNLTNKNVGAYVSNTFEFISSMSLRDWINAQFIETSIMPNQLFVFEVKGKETPFRYLTHRLEFTSI
jgi:hypothetical protein